MAKKQPKFQDIINGRISLLFFYLLLFAGVLWAERFARYRYDYIFRSMLPWLLPVLFALAAVAFTVLLALWLKGGKKDSGKLISLSFSLLLPIPLMAGFLFPWLTLFANGLQFFRLATELVFYAALGGFAGYIAYYKVCPAAAWMAGAATLDILALFYFYDRFLAPSSFILNTAEFGYLPGWAVALCLAGAVLLGCLMLRIVHSKKKLQPWHYLLPGALTVAVLLLNAWIPFEILPIRCMIYGSMALIGLWFLAWCILKKKKKGGFQ